MERYAGDGRVYELPGLCAALRLKGHRPPPAGEGGLGGRKLSDRSAERADEYGGLDGMVPGLLGGEVLKSIELGRDGEARGTMSLGSPHACSDEMA